MPSRPNSSGSDLRAISTEGLIGFKLQGLVNDPRRTQDLEDIRALLKANRTGLDLTEIREYFHLFKRDSLLNEREGGIQVPPRPPADPYQALDDLMAAVEILCPAWPTRETFKDAGGMLL